MSIYDHRDRPAYEAFSTNPDYCAYLYVLKWWSASHDQLISQQIGQKQWAWPSDISSKIVAIPHQKALANGRWKTLPAHKLIYITPLDRES